MSPMPMSPEELRANILAEAVELENAESERIANEKQRIAAVESKLNQCKADVHGALVDLTRRIESVESIQQLIHKIHDSSRATEDRMNNLMLSFSSYAAKQDQISKGFPSGDPDGHRLAHEAWIKGAQAKAEFWAKLRDKLAETGVMGAVGFLALAAWLAFKNEIHK